MSNAELLKRVGDRVLELQKNCPYNEKPSKAKEWEGYTLAIEDAVYSVMIEFIRETVHDAESMARCEEVIAGLEGGRVFRKTLTALGALV